MKRYRYIYYYLAILLTLTCGITACSENLLTNGLPEENLHGLVLQLTVDGNPVATPSVATTRIAADPTLNENLVEQVDVFFLNNDNNNLSHIHATLGADNRLVLAGADWKTQYNASSYTVYVIANRHNTDDLSGITTVEQLQALTDRDNDVWHVEGETILGASEAENTTYTGKTFLMNGNVNWTPPATDDATITVDLKRAAAKIVVNVSYSESFVKDEVGIIAMRKKMVNYASVANALTPQNTDYSSVEVMGDAGASGFSMGDYTNEEGDATRIDRLYAYTYPNQWGDNPERETYLLMNIPFSTGTGTGDYHGNNYYKVPIRFSANAENLRLDRNMQYTVNVTVDRQGNAEIDEPVELKPTFNVEEWETKCIDVDDDSPNYLVLSDYDIQMHNVADTTITFFSSSELASVVVTDAYFINKSGQQVREDTRGQIKDNYCSVNYDHGTLTGEIRFTSQVPTNVTARYITLEVTNTDRDSEGNAIPIKRTVTIVQYPLEYIMGVPGVYATRSDLEERGNTYENYRDHTPLRNQPPLSESIFQSKVYTTKRVDFGFLGSWDVTGIFYVGYEQGNNRYYLIADSFDSGHDNNRMYLVQIKSTDGEITVARPKMQGSGENALVVSDDENNRVVSPAFMLASQLGTVSSTNDWETARTHCQRYVEVAQYPDGETKRFADWRLPTFAELKVIAGYQYTQPDVMDEVLAGARYWSSHEDRYLMRDNADAEDPSVSRGGTSCFIRCIRDVTPTDLEEFAAHGIR